MDLQQALKDMSSYKFGQSRKSLVAIGNLVRDSHGKPAEREQLRKRLAGFLSSDATPDSKRFACEQLSIIGTAAEVPALAKFLTDEEMSHPARIALERILDAAARDALRDSLSKTKGKLLVGAINSLGERREEASAEALLAFLNNSDEEVAGAAAAALGKIGGRQAVGALVAARSTASPKVRATIADALLACAERLVKSGRKEAAGGIYEGLASPDEAREVREAARRGLKAVEQ
jgi:HEAT repeat protein